MASIFQVHIMTKKAAASQRSLDVCQVKIAAKGKEKKFQACAYVTYLLWTCAAVYALNPGIFAHKPTYFGLGSKLDHVVSLKYALSYF